MYHCPNCAAEIGYLGTAYVCPATRTSAPPHQPLSQRAPVKHKKRRKRSAQPAPPVNWDLIYGKSGGPGG